MSHIVSVTCLEVSKPVDTAPLGCDTEPPLDPGVPHADTASTAVRQASDTDRRGRMGVIISLRSVGCLHQRARAMSRNSSIVRAPASVVGTRTDIAA